MHLVYNLVLILITPLLVAYHCYRSVSRGRPSALKERFGSLDPETRKMLAGVRPIWVHAVSVGETIAAKPLLAALKRTYPDRPLIVSNMTETGRTVAKSLNEIDGCIYFPFDYSFAVRRLLQSVDPCLVIIVETEIWPNFLRQAKQLGIPTMIVNGRISDRSYGRYLRLRPFFAPVLAHVTAFSMQSRLDAERIVAVGAPPERVTVGRNLKFDIPAKRFAAAELDEIRDRFGIDGALQVLTAGSTHQGEEAQILDAFCRLKAANGTVVLILVPRHPERAAEVADLLGKYGLNFSLRSRLSTGPERFRSGEVLLVDTIGELMSFYAIADLVFVGGSLVPTGGHNLLEPASLGRPVLFGPHMSNFREIAAMTIDYGAGLQVASADELAANWASLLADAERRNVMGEGGRRLLAEQGGATGLNMETVANILQGAA